MYPALRQKTTAPPPPRPEVRQAVKKILTEAPAFAHLPAATQQEVARNTALIADYLAAPEGIEGQKIPGGLGTPTAKALADNGVKSTSDKGWEAVGAIGKGKFEAGAAMAGAKVAGVFLKEVDFVNFVGGLIRGVFQAIVDSSIRQMEEYGKLVSQVAKSLESFRDDNVTANQGRDHMVDKFPDLFEIGVDDFSDNPSPRLKLRDGIDDNAALRRVNSTISFEGGALKSMDLSDDDVETALVTAARTQLARQRQQLLASLVLMGINRIVVTDGRISAKVQYKFGAIDTNKKARTASAYDYATQGGGIATTSEGEGSYDTGGESSGKGKYEQNKGDYDYSSDYYAKGDYKYAQKPIVTATSVASETSDARLQASATLSGSVDVNFKSDYLPLEKVATPGMIAAIQGNSTPVDPNVLPSARTPQTPAQTGAAQPAQQTQQAPAPAAAP